MLHARRNSHDLGNLAARASELHSEVTAAQKRGLEYVLDAGDVLIEAREWVPHGGWGKWLDGVGINERTARLYMQVARGREELKTASVAGLSEAAAWLASVSTTPPPGHVFLATQRGTEDECGFPRTIAIVPSARNPNFFHAMWAEPGGEAVMTIRPVSADGLTHYGIPDRVNKGDWKVCETDAGYLDGSRLLPTINDGDINPFKDFLGLRAA